MHGQTGFYQILVYLSQKRGFNGCTGVIDHADSEYDIVNTMWWIFVVVYD